MPSEATPEIGAFSLNGNEAEFGISILKSCYAIWCLHMLGLCILSDDRKEVTKSTLSIGHWAQTLQQVNHRSDPAFKDKSGYLGLQEFPRGLWLCAGNNQASSA